MKRRQKQVMKESVSIRDTETQVTELSQMFLLRTLIRQRKPFIQVTNTHIRHSVMASNKKRRSCNFQETCLTPGDTEQEMKHSQANLPGT